MHGITFDIDLALSIYLSCQNESTIVLLVSFSPTQKYHKQILCIYLSNPIVLLEYILHCRGFQIDHELCYKSFDRLHRSGKGQRAIVAV